jgi:hypothetical protein
MGYAEVAIGAASASLSPSFGQPTGSGNLLLCWLAANSDSATPPFTTSSDGWNIPEELQFGTAFAWSGLAWKAGSSAGETPPAFGPSGTSAPFSMLGEFSGAPASSPVDQVGNGGGGGGADQVATCSAPDTQGGDLLAGVAYWNGGASAPTITTTLTDSDGNPVTANSASNSGSSGILYDFTWGIAGPAAGPGGDELAATLSAFSGGCCGIVSFSPASGGTDITAALALALAPLKASLAGAETIAARFAVPLAPAKMALSAAETGSDITASLALALAPLKTALSNRPAGGGAPYPYHHRGSHR